MSRATSGAGSGWWSAFMGGNSPRSTPAPAAPVGNALQRGDRPLWGNFGSHELTPRDTLRDTGFGLNQNRGFNAAGPRPPIMVGNNSDIWNINNQGLQRELFARGQAGDNYRAQLAAEASRYPHELRQSRFNTLLPYFYGQLNDLNNERVGGQSPAGPPIRTDPILNEQQIQQQVNAANARNEVATGTAMRNLLNTTGGRAVGANSPMVQAIMANLAAANLNTNTGNETNLRLAAAKDNRQLGFNIDRALEEQFATRQQEDIARRQALNQQRAAILGFGSSLIG